MFRQQNALFGTHNQHSSTHNQHMKAHVLACASMNKARAAERARLRQAQSCGLADQPGGEEAEGSSAGGRLSKKELAAIRRVLRRADTDRSQDTDDEDCLVDLTVPTIVRPLDRPDTHTCTRAPSLPQDLVQHSRTLTALQAPSHETAAPCKPSGSGELRSLLQLRKCQTEGSHTGRGRPDHSDLAVQLATLTMGSPTCRRATYPLRSLTKNRPSPSVRRPPTHLFGRTLSRTGSVVSTTSAGSTGSESGGEAGHHWVRKNAFRRKAVERKLAPGMNSLWAIPA
eukprot:comp20130_c0_seq1/m.24858 comp20130_c0_seq1/g.24858  ORF comp20130_c0_seq1/g.24858 comp20130_c0_seq1/m.24858 type:complete len:284 (-) comp20130_c0_seq1:299-1150(-)